MKWVHFIPTVETSSATVEMKMLSSNTALVAWTSARRAEVVMFVTHIQSAFIKTVIVGHVSLSKRLYITHALS